MLGNDIIDLKKAKTTSNWKRKGYLAKIFNLGEQAEILNSAHPEIILWLLWSMKEATYKIINRESLQRFYNPKKFSCKLNGAEGFVSFEDSICYTKSVINENLIHTIASTKNENLTLFQTSYLENTNDYLSEFNSKSANYILGKNENGIPNLVNKNNGESHFASISHHGAYLAIVFPKNLKI